MQQHLCFGRISHSQMLVTTVFWLPSIKLQHSQNSHQTCVSFILGEALIEILCWNTLVNIQRTFFNQERDESNVHVIITELAAYLWKLDWWKPRMQFGQWCLTLFPSDILKQLNPLSLACLTVRSYNNYYYFVCVHVLCITFFIEGAMMSASSKHRWLVILPSNLAQAGFVVFQLLGYGCNLIADKLLKAKLPQ